METRASQGLRPMGNDMNHPSKHGNGGLSRGLSRGRVALLAALSFLLVTGSPADPADVAAAPPAFEVEASIDHATVASTLREANRRLSTAQSERIADAVMRYSAKYELDPALVTAVILVESGGRPEARSGKGALGLMQVMPYMLRPLGLAGSPSSVETNIEAGCIILGDNIRRWGEEDGISAYFWGSEIRGVAYLNRVQAARERVLAAL
ncbi:MAG: lytic transglycosylase domain-containing protein [Myxococcota bacterium]|nr:lytic transglycosylase domain-containing protein [Myxococcota bacterium]